VNLFDQNTCGILFPACEAGHPDHDVTLALGQRVVRSMPVRKAWEYSLYDWNGQEVRFLNGRKRAPEDEVLGLGRAEATTKEQLLRCYVQEYPRILQRCPLAGETFRPARLDVGAGPADRPEPGWTCRLSAPMPREVDEAIAEIRA
jgi:hypothetical protein